MVGFVRIRSFRLAGLRWILHVYRHGLKMVLGGWLSSPYHLCDPGVEAQEQACCDRSLSDVVEMKTCLMRMVAFALALRMQEGHLG